MNTKFWAKNCPIWKEKLGEENREINKVTREKTSQLKEKQVKKINRPDE